MSRSPSPASSLDFVDSSGSEAEYVPVRRKRAAPARRAGAAAPKGPVKINLTALHRAQAVASAHPVEGDVDEDDEDDGGDMVMGRRTVDLSGLDLKADHAARPLWVDEHGNIILEAFAAFAQQAQEFLIAIAEPVSRPSLIHEYKITKPSLHAAMSVGLETNDIIEVLSRLSKIPLPHRLVEQIADWTSSYGKIRLVLKHNRYFLESTVPDFLRTLLNDEVIGPCRIVRDNEEALQRGNVPRRDFAIEGTDEARRLQQQQQQNGAANGDAPVLQETGRQKERDDVIGAVIGIDETDEMDEDDAVHSFEVSGEKMEDVRRRCKDIDLPALEEYDFRNDTQNPNLDIQLKPMTVIRPYQETSLAKMFGNGRARSGIIVLPCGAGKTLVGITAACTIKKSVLVLCTSAVSVAQWKQQFLHFSNISERQICAFTQGEKEIVCRLASDNTAVPLKLSMDRDQDQDATQPQDQDQADVKFSGPAGVVISTYTMIAKTGKRAHDAEKVMQFLRSREWGFLLMDEVHVVPADMFRKCVSGFKVHAKLGLTATLVREDDKIGDLGYLIGPKLYEANWMDLAKNGHIATVQCAEVWCPMTPEFYAEYLQTKSRKRILLHAVNPNKFQACQYLIHYHESRGDKIIVFSDNVWALERYAHKLGKPYIHGGTPEGERLRILSRFQHDPALNTIFLSKVGDTSIDLPEATCLIQISSHFGSRRQEAQRLGRILRAKRRNDEGFNAFFYSLVSKDTQEMWYSSKRQGFLIDQGYAFKVITELHGLDQLPGLVFPTKAEQISLLEDVVNQSGEMAETSDHYSRLSSGRHQHKKPTGPTGLSGSGLGVGGVPQAQRFNARLEELSGGHNLSYREQNKSLNKELAREERQNKKAGASSFVGVGGGKEHALFRKRNAEIAKKRKAANQ